MSCHVVRDANGGITIMCGRKLPKQKLCAEPACHHDAGFECDWTVGKKANGRKRTCDRLICEPHALQVGDNQHLCPEHAALWAMHPANPANARQKKLYL